MTGLLDVNVLLALAWPQHVHHATATAWFDADDELAWATTALTELGFVRVSANPAFVDEAVTPAEAVRLLVELTGHGRHERWTDDLPLDDPGTSWNDVVTHRQVTDARLLALARHAGGRVVTFDQGMRSLAGGDGELVDVLQPEPPPDKTTDRPENPPD